MDTSPPLVVALSLYPARCSPAVLLAALEIMHLALEVPHEVADVFVNFYPNSDALEVAAYLGGWTDRPPEFQRVAYCSGPLAYGDSGRLTTAGNLLETLSAFLAAASTAHQRGRQNPRGEK